MQVKFGYMASLGEQYEPNIHLDRVVMAEKAGFQEIWTSDHFHPWVHTNASAGFAWVWMAAAAERTKLPVGTAVTAPTFRYHPAVVAQAFATLAAMYPNRIRLGIGVGEPLNESPLGFQWPPVEERIEKFEEAVQVIKLLWSKTFIEFSGKYYQLRKANLYTKPEKPPPLYIATGGPKMSRLAGKYADGLITFIQPEQSENFYQRRLFRPLEESARENKRDPSKFEKVVMVEVSYDEDYDRALKACRFWSSECLSFVPKYDVSDPREIEKWSHAVGDEAMAKIFLISNQPDEHIRRLELLIKAGFTHLDMLSFSPNEEKFLEMYKKHVIPYIQSTYGAA
jgi:coenzyme F420-dependent glucose-6-phosphate dehydrogenase